MRITVCMLAFLMAFVSKNLFAQQSPSEDLLSAELASETFLGDFDEMVERRLIRVLVAPNRTNYFIDRAAQSGITYEFFNEFEKQINQQNKTNHLKTTIIYIPVTRDELVTSLIEGRGDIAAASLTVTDERLAVADFTDPLASDINEIIVTAADSPAIESIDDLSGKTLHVRESSSYYESLKRLNGQLTERGSEPVNIEFVDEYLEDEDLLEMVNAGLLSMIVVDDYLADFWSSFFPDIRLHPEIKVNSGGEIAWMIRKNSPELAGVLNEFIKEHKLGTLFGNIMKKRYFENTDYVARAFNSDASERLKQAADLFKKYSATYEFDWLMIAALSFQESGIDQSVVSPVGAVGVMQVLPSTAAGDPINIAGIDDIDNNIHAGVKYLRWIYDTYFKDETQVDDLNKVLFTFASYNAGPGKVASLRKQAGEMGLSPDIWFNNVEIAAAKAIGRETVQYVSNIYKYYFAYKNLEELAEIKQG